jgi:hypothetical protein
MRGHTQATALLLKLAGDVVEAHISFLKVCMCGGGECGGLGVSRSPMDEVVFVSSLAEAACMQRNQWRLAVLD